MRRRTPAVALATLLTLLLMVAGAIGVAPPAHTVDDPQPVVVELEAVDPALPARDGTITLRGRAINRSGQLITSAQVVLWRRTMPVTSTAELGNVTALEPNEVQGSQEWGSETSYRRLTDELNPVWEPGETREFEVSAPVADLAFPRIPGVYLVGAEIVGRVAGDPLTTVGLTRSMVPLAADGAATTSGVHRVVTAVVLSSRPSMTAPGVFVDNHLADELAPGGRLTLLLDAAGRNDVSWVIDPAVHQEITAMAAGYKVEGQDELDPAGQQHALRWLADFGQLNQDNGFRAPFALPDVSMMANQDLGAVMRRVVAAGEQGEPFAGLPLLAYAHGGLIDPTAVQLAEAEEPVAILAANPDSRGALLSPIDDVPLVNYSLEATSGGPGPDPRTGVVQVRQRLLAQSFLTAIRDPNATTVRVITTAASAAAEPATNAPWVRRATLGALLGERPVGWSGLMPYEGRARAGELTPAQVQALRKIAAAYDDFAGILVDPQPVEDEINDALARSVSSWWRHNPAGFDTFVRPRSSAVHQLDSGEALSLAAQGSVLMSGQSGSFPMTVSNRLDRDVRVILTFDSDQPQRLSIPPMRDIVVGARESVTVNVQPQAVGNGPVRVSALVTTSDGTPLSKRAWLTVEATDLGRVGWIIVVASGIVMLAATMLRIRQVRRERAHEAPADPIAPARADHVTPPVVTIDRASKGDER